MWESVSLRGSHLAVHVIQPMERIAICAMSRLTPRVRALAGQAGTRDRKIAVVRRFYEEGWSNEDTSVLLDALVAEDHIQEDRVWQSEPRLGRESVKKGIAFIRSVYPDVCFTVDDAAVTDDEERVFARWTLQGTFESQQDRAHGLAILTVNDDCMITRTEVFRQATRAEVELAKRSERGPVGQSCLLVQGTQW